MTRRIVHFVIVAAVGCVLNSAQFAQNPSSWPETEKRLVQEIAANDPEQIRTALFEIRNIRTEQASRLAIPALNSPNEIIRAAAAGTVVFLPKADAAKRLAPLLDDKMPFVRKEAAYTLGRVGSSSATSRLMKTAQADRDTEVRSAAVIAIGNIGDISAIEGLTAILRGRPSDDNELLRRSAARSIGQIAAFSANNTTSIVTPQNFLPPKFKKVGKAIPPQLKATLSASGTVAVLTGVIKDTREAEDTRREAAFALGSIGDASSSAILQANLNSPDPYLAEICREAVIKIGR